MSTTLPAHGWNYGDHTGSDTALDDLMVIGIDFGTTYSGAAWATLADFDNRQINSITTWPGTGREEGKAPTELFYDDGQIRWGFEVSPGCKPARWFKLLLLKNEDLPKDHKLSEYLIRARKILRERNMTAIQLVADYLRVFWQHILETITKARGILVVDALRFHVVISVPAIWKTYAREKMTRAAREAGILDFRTAGATTLSFVPEPEAAALSTLSDPSRKVARGDVYVICDAGGGTVDLISYVISNVCPIAMKEVVEGTGDICGGIFIDEEFEGICEKRLGEKWDHLSRKGINEIMKGDWEQCIKPQFKPTASGREYIVSVPAEAFGASSLDDTSSEPYIKKGRIHFKESHIKEAFDKAFFKINQLVSAQIEEAKRNWSPIAGIILVGGLGGSPYLYDYLNSKYTAQGIPVLQSSGMKPRTAICQGAVLKGFMNISQTGPISVVSTISRASYGVDYQVKFNENIHLAKDKQWDTDEGEYKAINQMQWYLKRGDESSIINPVRHSWYQLRRASEKPVSLSIRLFQCGEIDSPSRKESSVTHLCDIVVKLDAPCSALEDFTTRTGKSRKILNYEIEMVPSGASVNFIVYFQGRKQAEKNVAIEFGS